MEQNYIPADLTHVNVAMHPDFLGCNVDPFALMDASYAPYDAPVEALSPESWSSASGHSTPTSSYLSPHSDVSVETMTSSLGESLHIYNPWSASLENYRYNFTYSAHFHTQALPEIPGETNYVAHNDVEPVEMKGLDIALAYSPVSPLSTISELSIPNLPSLSPLPNIAPLPTAPPPRASAESASTLVSQLLASTIEDSDIDAEGESDHEETDDEEDDDGEYVPKGLPPLRERRSYRHAYNSTPSSRPPRPTASARSRRDPAMRPSPSSSCTTLSPEAQSVALSDISVPKACIVRTKPRRVQAKPGDSIICRRSEDPNDPAFWECDICGYVQKNKRKPDFYRHASSHCREMKQGYFICTGVPVAEAADYPVDLGTMKMQMVRDMPMVGGCYKEFCRKDALHRHMRDSKQCIGDLDGWWHLFKQEEEEKAKAKVQAQKRAKSTKSPKSSKSKSKPKTSRRK